MSLQIKIDNKKSSKRESSRKQKRNKITSIALGSSYNVVVATQHGIAEENCNRILLA